MSPPAHDGPCPGALFEQLENHEGLDADGDDGQKRKKGHDEAVIKFIAVVLANLDDRHIADHEHENKEQARGRRKSRGFKV